MNVPGFIARRYLFSKKSRNVINIISGISMFVVACVTASMICIMSAFNGIEELVEGLFTTFDADISITPAKGKSMVFSEDTLDLIAAVQYVEQTSQIIEDDAIFRYQGNPTVAKILGVDSAYASITQIQSKIVNGEYQISSSGTSFATLGYGIKTELWLSNPTDISSQLLSVSTPIRGKKLSKYREKALNTEAISVSGIFSVNAELDVKYVIVPIHFARNILGYSSTEMSRLDISVDADENMLEVKKELQSLLGENFKVLTRQDKNAFVHQTNQSEKWATFLILTFILVIAAFNVLASLTMLIIEKRADIDLLRSIGMTKSKIRKIFTFQGVAINAIGAFIGLLIGLGLCLLQIQFGLIELPDSVVPSYPISIKLEDILLVIVTVMAIGSVFSLLMVRYLVRRFTH